MIPRFGALRRSARLHRQPVPLVQLQHPRRAIPQTLHLFAPPRVADPAPSASSGGDVSGGVSSGGVSSGGEDVEDQDDDGGDDLPEEVYALIQIIVGGESGDKKFEIPTPTTWREASSGDQSAEWNEAQAREQNGLKRTGTYSEVPRSEAKNIIKSKWVYGIKRSKITEILYKARIVAKGFSQKFGVDFFETWAPTARQATTRLLLHLGAALELDAAHDPPGSPGLDPA